MNTNQGDRISELKRPELIGGFERFESEMLYCLVLSSWLVFLCGFDCVFFI